MTLNKEVVKRWAKAFDHHHIKASFRTEPMGVRDIDGFVKLCVDPKFVVQSTIIPFQGLEFDYNPFPRENIVCEV